MRFHKYRLFVVIGALFLVWSLLLLRAFSVQVLPHEKLKALKEKQFKRVVTLQPSRGIVFDKNNKELAASITAYSLFADPSLIQNPTDASYKIASLIKKNPKAIRKIISDKDKKFVWIERKMTEEMKDRILSYKIPGIGFVEESKRIYPNHNLLSHVLGFVGQDGQGLEGIEKKFNEALSGDQKKLLVQKDARGRPLIVNGKLFNDQPDGLSVQLTIDSEIQHVLEQELRGSVLENNADSAVGIVMEAQTNKLLALASVPDFNPNEALTTHESHRKNRAIVDPFEPGSTLKPFIVAGALRDGKLNPSSKYYCEKGSFKVADRVIKESDSKHKFEWLSVTDILAKSSNIGMVKIGFELGAQKTHEVLRDFGFGTKTGITLGGDTKGIIPQTPWREVKLANVSFGQGIAVSALQLANAYTAIANGGILREPLLVESVTDSQTGEKETFATKDIRRVLTQEQAKTMLTMLTSVTQDEGTAVSARVAGFPVAGKTGTAQKVDPLGRGYMKGAYIASFAGILPAHDPKYVIYIAVDNPKNKKYYGSELAAPIFSKVGSFVIRKSGVAPVLLTQESLINKNKQKQKKSLEAISAQVEKKIGPTEDSFLNLSIREVIQKSKQTNIPVRIYGSGKSYSVESEYDGDGIKEYKIYFQ